MNEFTKGPWHVGMKPGPIIYGPFGEQVADMRDPMLGTEENASNARLIAAAGTAATKVAEMGFDGVKAVEALPEALDELEWFVEFVYEHEEWFGGFDEDNAENAWLNRVEALLAKARGKA